jgi:hypothetical protein
MRPILAYPRYRDEWHGGLDEGGFLSALPKAAALVDWLTAHREVTDGNADAYLDAICAAVDSIAEHGADDSPLTGFRLGSLSVSMGDAAPSGKDLAVSAARMQLAPAVPSLTYGGVA